MATTSSSSSSSKAQQEEIHVAKTGTVCVVESTQAMTIASVEATAATVQQGGSSLTTLPEPVLHRSFSYLTLADLGRCMSTCQTLQHVAGRHRRWDNEVSLTS